MWRSGTGQRVRGQTRTEARHSQPHEEIELQETYALPSY